MGYDHRYGDKLAAIDEMQSESVLMDFFEGAYRNKFRVPYVSPLKLADITFFSDLKRQVGLPRAKAIIMHFFKLDTYNTKSRGHTVPVLKAEINIINAALGSKDPLQSPQSSDSLAPWIKVNISCDDCFKNFELVIQASRNAFDRRMSCEQCRIRNKAENQVSVAHRNPISESNDSRRVY